MNWEDEDRVGEWAGWILTIFFIAAVIEVLLHFDDIIAVFKVAGSP